MNADSVIGCYFIESDLRQQTDSEMSNHQRNHLVTFICLISQSPLSIVITNVHVGSNCNANCFSSEKLSL